MALYIRQDTANNIANTKRINADTLDSEFDALAAAFLLLNNPPLTFNTRSEATSANTEANKYIIVEGLFYILDDNNVNAAITSSDGYDYMPFGKAYPDHWASNTTPGTTDMSDALIAVLKYSSDTKETAYLKGTSYYVTKNIRTYARSGLRLKGAGADLSKIVAETGSYNVLTFYTGETNGSGTPLSCNYVRLEEFSIENSGVQRTGGWFINFEERTIQGTLRNVHIRGAYNGVDYTAAGQSEVENLKCFGDGRSTTGGILLNLSSSASAGAWDVDDITSHAKCTDLKVTGFEVKSGTSSTNTPYSRGVFIGAADGIYFNNTCHIQNCSVAVELATAQAAGRVVVSSVDFNETYFDGTSGQHILFTGYGNGETWTPGGGTQGAHKFRDINFNSCRFRESQSVSGSVSWNMDAGAVERVSFNKGTSRENYYSSIRDATNATPGVKYLTVDGMVLAGNNTQDSSTGSEIYIRSNFHKISNLFFVPSDAAQTTSGNLITLLSGGGGNSEIKHCNTISARGVTDNFSVQSTDFVSFNTSDFEVNHDIKLREDASYDIGESSKALANIYSKGLLFYYGLGLQTLSTSTDTIDPTFLGKIVRLNNNGPTTLTIPANADEEIAVGSILTVHQTSDYTSTIQADTGVTLNGVSGGSGTLAFRKKTTLIKVNTNTWEAWDDIGVVS